MRERRKPKIVKFSSLPWLVNFLNLRFDSEKPRDRKNVEVFLAESSPQDDVMTARNAQERIIYEITPVGTMQAFSPAGLVYHLNDWAETNNIRPHWFYRPLETVSALDAGESVLTLGSRNWHVLETPLVHGTEGQVLMSISQCLQNGELARIRRCLQCRRFFITDDARRRFCKAKHQREYDAQASKARVAASRERQKAKALGLKPPKKKAKEPPISSVTDEQRFADFLQMANGSVIPGSELALFIEKKVRGEWRTVTGWLKDKHSPDAIWTGITENTKDAFRDFWG